MATQSTYIGVAPVTLLVGASDVVRGVRVSRDTSNLVTVQDITARGDFVTLTSGEATYTCEGASMQSAGHVPALASEATAIGDTAYSAASGKFSKTSGGGAVLCGTWIQAASGDGVLGMVELANPL